MGGGERDGYTDGSHGPDVSRARRMHARARAFAASGKNCGWALIRSHTCTPNDAEFIGVLLSGAGAIPRYGIDPNVQKRTHECVGNRGNPGSGMRVYIPARALRIFVHPCFVCSSIVHTHMHAPLPPRPPPHTNTRARTGTHDRKRAHDKHANTHIPTPPHPHAPTHTPRDGGEDKT